MPCSLHLISNSIPGYGPPDGRCRLPCSGVSGKAMSISSNSFRCDYKLIPGLKLRCVSMRISTTVCSASSGNYRRSPDYTRQNKQSYSRNRNRNSNNEERDGFEEVEDLSQRNGALLSFSGNQKFQASASPGPREKEIVELFRKVQAQLRERAVMKDEKKVDDSQVKNNREDETVDSLLKLLRKHSVQQGKKSSNSIHNREFILDDPEKVGPSTEEDLKIQEVPSPQLSRPKSNFQKRSPVPPMDSVNGTLKPESEQVEVGNDNAVALLSEEILFDEMSDDEEEAYEDEHNPTEISKLNGMKLTELRALAKSLGMKGFSKLKKNDLVHLLSTCGSL